MSGWKVKKIDHNTYKLSKKMDEAENFNLANFIEGIISFDVVNYDH